MGKSLPTFSIAVWKNKRMINGKNIFFLILRDFWQKNFASLPARTKIEPSGNLCHPD